MTTYPQLNGFIFYLTLSLQYFDMMEELFTEDQCSSVRGKRGTLPALDQETMDAILCKY